MSGEDNTEDAGESMSNEQYSCRKHEEYDNDCAICHMRKSVAENQEAYDAMARAGREDVE